MKKNTILLIGIIFLFLSIEVKAQPPAGYYDSATGTGETLKTQLFNIIKNPNVTSYSGLWTAFKTTDRDNYYENDQTVMDMYSENPSGADPYTYNYTSDQCGTYSTEGDCYNREHSFPKSWFGDASPMYSDIVHLVPTDGSVNGRRSNYPFGNVASASWTSQNGSKLGSCSSPSYSGTVFEPIDEFKGDFARIYFYMATCYEDKISSWNSACLAGNSFPCYEPWFLTTLLEWNTLDPVSQKEIDRNDGIYATQGNRNPYVDHPEWVECVWNSNCNGIVQNPANLSATPFSETQINLSWNLNNDNDNIVLAYNTTNTFGTPTGTYTAGNTITGGGEVLYIGNSTTFNHTSLQNQMYYYKMWSINSSDEYSTGIAVQERPLQPLADEPTNHPTSFTTLNPTASTLELTWSDAIGDVLPFGYLIKANVAGNSIATPTDGQPEADGIFTKNIAYGEQNITFENLDANTSYDFKIFAYTNSNTDIDYKIDGTVPQTTGTTTNMPTTCGNETFETIPTAMYENISWIGQDGSTWNATDTRCDQNIGSGKAICVRNGYAQSGTIVNGISDITISTFLPFSDDDGDLTVLVNGNSVGTVPYSTTQTLTTTISGINISGDIVIKLETLDAKRVIIDNVVWSCFGSSSGNDADSDISNPTTQVASVTIPSTEDNFVDVFAFSAEDKGTTDGLSTFFSSLKLYPKFPENTADWTSSINSIKVNDGTNDLSLATVSITDNYINIPFTAPYEILDNTSSDFTISIKINGNQIENNSVLAFMIDVDNSGFFTENSGSSFASVLNSGNDIFSNTFTLTSPVTINNIEKIVKIYPNPSKTGIFIIQTHSANQIIEVYNINGQTLKTVSTKINNFTELDLSKFAKGIYFVKINNNNKTSWAKIIIE